MCDAILSRSSADAAQVRVVSGLTAFTRYAGNGISASGDSIDAEATLTSIYGERAGTVVWNDLRDAAVGNAVTRSEQLAEVAPADPERMPMLGAQQYADSPAFFSSTHEVADADRVERILAVTDLAAGSGLRAAGSLESLVQSEVVANTAGLFAYHRHTVASQTVTVRTSNGTGSGWSGTVHNDWDQLTSPTALVERAIGKALGGAGAQALDPGGYTVVLEPAAVGNLVRLLASALDARSADEGGSFFSGMSDGNKLGEQVIDERLTLSSDPLDPDLLAAPFDESGLPLSATSWIEDGVLRNLVYGRYWAAQSEREPRPAGGGLKLAGGTGSIDELVATVDRGLLVTRLCNVSPVDSRRLVYSGFTRNGTFLIENGRVGPAVGDLWFTESLSSMLNNVVAIGSTERVVAFESGGPGASVAVPPMVVRGFHLTSLSETG